MPAPFIAHLRDANLAATKALPSAASTTVTTDAIDLGNNAKAVDVVVDVPALSGTILPDGKTMTTTIEVSNAANFSPASTISTTVQTGATTTGGAAAVDVRASVPPTFRYVRAKIVSGANTADASALSSTLAVVV